MRDLGSSLIAITERDPDRLAVVDGDRRESYATWLDAVLRLVSGLDGLGLERGDHVVSVLQNRYEAATLHWACQIAGIAITPLNWRARAEEVDYVLGDADARAAVFEPVSQEAVLAAAAGHDLPTVAVTGASGAQHDFDTLLSRPAAPPVSRAREDDVSVMLYTSGTTGRGKGVPRSHRAERTAALAHVAQNRYGYGERTLGVMPLYHTMGVRSLLAMALINGRFVCQPRFNPGEALSLIEAEAITNLYLVPTLYHDLLADDGFSATRVRSVGKLGFAGAPMTDGLLKRCQAAFEPELFVNHYGSSEIYTFTICPDATAKPGSAGKAGINQRIRLVALGSTSPDDQVDVGVEGQIIASLESEEAFAGYWRRPDADEKSLHEGWYFTGDIGYRDADGDLFVTGRVDDMVISGGENILPVEIESVLSLHDAVAEVAVAGLPDERLGQRVTAFVRRGGAVDADTLDAWCRASDLAPFKRPREYVFVREIPKSPVGKILRRLLIAGEYQIDEN